jgi:ubiquinone/menaquinone biosynthesis C-methylase UbiE
MIGDGLRTLPLLAAIREKVRQGDVVVDIGTGLGGLAIEAAEAGAKKVYAIDCHRGALEIAKAEVQRRGLCDRVEFISGMSYDIKLPQRVDVIISETVGSFAFDENILATMKDARSRFLKKGGSAIPSALELWCVPIKRVPRLEMPAEIGIAGRGDLMAAPCMLVRVDFSLPFRPTVRAKAVFTYKRGGSIAGFAAWPKVFWSKTKITDASPFKEATHWKHGIMPVEKFRVEAGDKVGFEMLIIPHPDDPLRMTERLWRVV